MIFQILFFINFILRPPRTIRITQTEETTWEERNWVEDRATPILDVSEFFASKRRSKKFPNS
jgi:hypothetical protein